MAVCRYCGRKIYWFTDVHSQCTEAARRGYSLIVAEVATAVNADKPFADVNPTLEQIRDRYKVLSAEMREAIKKGWANAAEQIGLAEPLNMHRHSIMTHFYQEAGITGKELTNTNGFKTATTSMMLWFAMVGRPMKSEHPHPFNLDRDEVPLVFFGSVVYYHKVGIRAYGRLNPEASVQLGHGHYYPYSSFMAERLDTRMLREIDYGGMLLTTRNIYFGGEYKSFRIPYEQIVKVRPFTDSLEMSRDITGAQCEVFTVANAWPACGWFLYNLTHFLGQPEARNLYGGLSKSSVLPDDSKMTNFISSPSPGKEWDVFISHASEDKEELVRPLAEALSGAGVSVWYDDFSLKLGDSLRKSIDFGLANSRYGIVVLSHNFFAKHWPAQELNGLFSKEVNQDKVLLPIWHRVGFDEVRAFSPMLADRVAANSAIGLERLVHKILETVRTNKKASDFISSSSIHFRDKFTTLNSIRAEFETTQIINDFPGVLEKLKPLLLDCVSLTNVARIKEVRRKFQYLINRVSELQRYSFYSGSMAAYQAKCDALFNDLHSAIEQAGLVEQLPACDIVQYDDLKAKRRVDTNELAWNWPEDKQCQCDDCKECRALESRIKNDVNVRFRTFILKLAKELPPIEAKRLISPSEIWHWIDETGKTLGAYEQQFEIDEQPQNAKRAQQAAAAFRDFASVKTEERSKYDEASFQRLFAILRAAIKALQDLAGQWPEVN